MANQPPPISRKNIPALIAALKLFRPLVNENQPTKFEPLPGVENPPDRDAILSLAAASVMDMQTFIRNFDHNQQMNAELRADAMMVHQEFQKIGLEVDSMAAGLEAIIGRHRQALDVIQFVAEHHPDTKTGDPACFDDLRKVCNSAQAYLDNMQKRLMQNKEKDIKSLVNENLNTNGIRILPSVSEAPAEEKPGSGVDPSEPRS